MINQRKIRRLSGRALASALAVALAAGPVLADTAESSLWSQRRRAAGKAAGSPPSGPQLALAAGLVPEVGRLFGGLPRPQSTSLAPSVANQISRFPAPQLRKRLTDVVRALPAQTGTVRDVVMSRGAAGQRIIVHIQDVHLNSEAQANIAAAVSGLVAARLAAVVGLEGAFSPIDLAPFRGYPDRPAMKKVAAFLSSEHKISGPIGALMVEDAAPAVVGVDSRERYDANVEAYRRANPLRAGHKTRVDQRERVLGEKKSAVYSPALARFDAAVETYDRGGMTLGAYIRLLARSSDDLPISIQSFLAAYEIENGLDFGRVEAERSRLLGELVKKLGPDEIERLVADSLEYRTGRMSHGTFYGSIRDLAARRGIALAAFPALDAYIRYVLLTDGIRPHDLYRDVDELREKAFAGLAATPEEKALVAEDERLNLAAKLLDFSLTPEEWKRYARESGKSRAFIGDLTDFENFYREADARNQALAGNLMREMSARNASVGVLVTGGFHAPGIGDLLAKAGVSMVSYAPRLTKVDFDGSAYLSVFSQEKAPLDQLFAGPELFLAQNPAPPASLNMGAVLAAAESRRTGTLTVDAISGAFPNVTILAVDPVDEIDEAGDQQVTYRRADGVEVRVIIRPSADGGFDIVPVTATGAKARAAVAAFLARLAAPVWRFFVRETPVAPPADGIAPTLGNLGFSLDPTLSVDQVTIDTIVAGLTPRLAERGFTIAAPPIRLGGGLSGDAYRIMLNRDGRPWQPGQPADTSIVVKIVGGDMGADFALENESLGDDALTLEQGLPGMPRNHGTVLYGGKLAAVMMGYSREVEDGTKLRTAVDLWNQGQRGPVRRLDANGRPAVNREGQPLYDHPMSPAEMTAQLNSLVAGNERVTFWDENGYANLRVYFGRLYQVDPGAFTKPENVTSTHTLADRIRAIVDTASLGWKAPLWTRIAFNTTFVLAPAIAAVVLGAMALFGAPVTVPIAAAVYVLAKLSFFAAAIAHELGHLWGDGRLDGIPIREHVLRAVTRPTPGNVLTAVEALFRLARLGARTLNRPYLAASFIAGTDIAHAYVTISKPDDEPRAVFEARVRRAAISGPLATVAMIGGGLAVVALGAAVGLLSGDAGFALKLTGAVFAATNAAFLILNTATGGDIAAWRSGLLPGRILFAFGRERKSGRHYDRDFGNGKAVSDVPLRLDDPSSYIALRLPGANSVVQIRRTSAGVTVTALRDARRLARRGADLVLQNGESARIGSGIRADMRLARPRGSRRLSRYHVLIEVSEDGDVSVRDLYSANGSQIDIRNPTASYELQEGFLDAEYVERSTTQASRTLASASISPDEASSDPREPLPAAVLERQPARVQALQAREQMEGIDDAQSARLDFLRAYIPILLRKSRQAPAGRTAQERADWMRDSSRYLEFLLNDAESLTTDASAAFVGRPLPSIVRVTGRGLSAEGQARRSGDLVTHWLAPDAAGNSLRLAINSAPDGRLLTLAVERRLGARTYAPVAGDNAILLAGALDVQVDYTPVLRNAQTGEELPIPRVAVTVRYRDGRVLEWTFFMTPTFRDIDVGSPRAVAAQRPQAPPPVQPRPRVFQPLPEPPADPASMAGPLAEIDRQLEDGDLVIVFNRRDLASGRTDARAYPMRELEARAAARAGRVQLVRRGGQAYLVWAAAEELSNDLSIALNPAISMAPRPPAESDSSRARVDEAMSVVSGTIGVVRNRFSAAMGAIAGQPEVDEAEQDRFVEGLIDQMVPAMFPAEERARVVAGLARVLRMRTWFRRLGDRILIAEDQGSGETIMGLRLEDYVGDAFDSGRPDAAERADLLFALYAAWSEQYRFGRSDEDQSGSRGDRRSRAMARFRQLVPDVVRLVGSEAASPEMIMTAAEILRRLPLAILDRTSDIGRRIAGGIDLSASRDQATRIGHYKEPEYDAGGNLVRGTALLGVQPTIFQFREFIETVLHEFGHVSEGAHLAPGSPLLALFAAASGRNTYAIGALGLSGEVRRGYIQSAEERFAETFLHYVVHGELFKEGFPGYTPAPDAWKAIYNYYRDNVFGGVEYRNGQPIGSFDARGVPDRRSPAVRVAPAAAPAPAGPLTIRHEYVGVRGKWTRPYAGNARLSVVGIPFVIERNAQNRPVIRLAGPSPLVSGLDTPLEITRAPLTLGRDPANRIIIDNPAASRRGLEIFIDDLGNVVIRDRSSNPAAVETISDGLTLPLTRDIAERLGLDPQGAVTELGLATVLEGIIPQHFIPGFLKRHGTPTIHQRIGVGIIWGVAILGLIAAQLAFGANLGVIVSAPQLSQFWAPLIGFWLGGTVGHFVYNLLARSMGWSRLTVGAVGPQIENVVNIVRAQDAAAVRTEARLRGDTLVMMNIGAMVAVLRADRAGRWDIVDSEIGGSRPVVSDSGQVVAYLHRGGLRVLVFGEDGMTRRDLPASGWELILSRDGRHLFVLTRIDGVEMAMVYRVESDGIRRIPGEIRLNDLPAWDAISAEGRFVLEKQDDGAVRALDVEADLLPLPVRVRDEDGDLIPDGEALAANVERAVISADGGTAAVVQADGTLRFFGMDEDGADETDETSGAQEASLFSLEDGIMAVIPRGDDFPPSYYRASSGGVTSLRRPLGQEIPLDHAFSGDGKVAAIATGDSIKIFRLVRFQYRLIGEFPAAMEDQAPVPPSLTVSRDGRTVSAVDSEGQTEFYRVGPASIRRMGTVDLRDRDLRVWGVTIEDDGGEAVLRVLDSEETVAYIRIGLATGEPIEAGVDDAELPVAVHNLLWRAMVATAKAVRRTVGWQRGLNFDRRDRQALGEWDEVSIDEAADAYVKLATQGPQSAEASRLRDEVVERDEQVLAPLTLPSTRAVAERLGLDPRGAVTELGLATVLEGIIPQHFIPGFLKRHGTPTIHQRIGIGVIWGVALLGLVAAQLAFGADPSAILSVPQLSQLWAPLIGFWLGGAIGHLIYNALARAFGWRALTLDEARRGDFVAPTAEARVGEALIASAVALAKDRRSVSVDQVLGEIVDFNMGEIFAGDNSTGAVAPGSVSREGVIAYVRENATGRLRPGDLSFVEAQRVAEKLSAWLGETVVIADRRIVAAARRVDAAKVAALAARGTRQNPVTLVVEAADAGFFQTTFAEAIAGGRLVVQPSATALFSGDNRIDDRALESAIVAALDPTQLGNVLLIVSNEVSFESTRLAPGSLLAQMRYKALEDLLNDLPAVRVLPLGIVIDAARVLAIQA